MLREGFKKYVALLLAVLVIVSSVAVVSAATINSSGGSASTTLTVDIAPYKGSSSSGNSRRFKCVIPTTFPVEMLEDGTIVVATNAAITNYSTDAVKVDNMVIKPFNSWVIQNYDDNLSLLPENTTAFAMQVLGSKANSDTGIINTSKWGKIESQESLVLPYNVKLPYFTVPFEGSIAELIVTVSYAD